MPESIAHLNVAEFLNEALGDLLDDVAFADLVEDVVARLGVAVDLILDAKESVA